MLCEREGLRKVFPQQQITSMKPINQTFGVGVNSYAQDSLITE